jgi:hypothetical protein
MERARAAFLASAQVEEQVARDNPEVVIVEREPEYVFAVPHTDGAPPVRNVLTLMTDPTGLDRAAVAERAATLRSTYPPRSLEYKCASAVRHAEHFPLIIGALPLPTTARFSVIVGVSRVHVVASAGAVTGDHLALLASNFQDHWVDHVDEMMRERAVVAYDLYSDAARTAHLGSLIVSKHAVRVRGAVYPMVSIESVVSADHGVGHGTTMLRFARLLLFSDVTDDVPYGYLLAQCLKIDFWDYRLDATVFAQTMVLQMEMLCAHYTFERLCTMRMSTLFNEDEGAPSPAKALP